MCFSISRQCSPRLSGGYQSKTWLAATYNVEARSKPRRGNHRDAYRKCLPLVSPIVGHLAQPDTKTGWLASHGTSVADMAADVSALLPFSTLIRFVRSQRNVPKLPYTDGAAPFITSNMGRVSLVVDVRSVPLGRRAVCRTTFPHAAPGTPPASWPSGPMKRSVSRRSTT
ncbi:hypothetical protein BC628DRAFT_144330 [Trametes gibbosa]|nr:hypothetical protein BC628DRAFT_144330 [Trametes gibbosa]